MTEDTSRDRQPSRRAMLAGVLGGLGAWVAAAAARVDPTAAAAGDPIRMGRLNRAAGTSTELQTLANKSTFLVRQLGDGNAVRAEAESGRAVVAVGGPNGTGVWAFSPNHNAIHARTESGYAGQFDGRVQAYSIELPTSLGDPITSATPFIATLFARRNDQDKPELCVKLNDTIVVIATEP